VVGRRPMAADGRQRGPAIQALPLTALVDALRAVVLEGATLSAVHRQLFVLAGWTIIPFALALRLFRWR
jgi:ABC-2 type transport system permease protein